MHRRFERYPGLAYDHSRLMARLEELKSEADHRSLGGFQTQDTQFARTMADLIRDMIEFMDGTDDMLLGMEQEFSSDLSYKQDEIDDLELRNRDLEEEVEAQANDIRRSLELKKLLRDILLDD